MDLQARGPTGWAALLGPGATWAQVTLLHLHLHLLLYFTPLCTLCQVLEVLPPPLWTVVHGQ